MPSFAIVDIETTGSKLSKDKITEIAIIHSDGQSIQDKYTSLIHPEKPVPYFITKLTGINNTMLSDAPKFYEVAKEIIRWTENRILVAHNVRFDYSFLKKEFNELAYNYNRKTLCTANFARKIMKGHASYSLGKLCHDLNISLTNHHRALSDAKACCELLHLLIKKDKKENHAYLDKKLTERKSLPGHMARKEMDKLPECPGVYFFYNKNKELIYVGKSKNIKQRVWDHMGIDLKSRKEILFKNEIKTVDFEKTGTELIALLYESYCIKKYKPRYNYRGRKRYYPYGIYLSKDKEGYLFLDFRSKHNQKEEPIIEMGSKASGESFIENFYAKHSLNQNHLTHANPQIKKLKQELYNLKFNETLKAYNYPDPNLLIISKGRHEDESSFILIKNGDYRGFGFLNKNFEFKTTKDLIFFLNDETETKDSKAILLSYLRKNKPKQDQWIHF